MIAIVMVDENWAIGKDGDQLCYIPEDLKRFQSLTSNSTIVCGRKTLATFPGGKPLKNRRNVVLTSDPDFKMAGVTVCHSIDEVLDLPYWDMIVVGGQSVYEQLLPYCNVVHVTKVHKAFADADAFFPNLNRLPEWYVTEEHGPFQYGDYSVSFCTYLRAGKKA